MTQNTFGVELPLSRQPGAWDQPLDFKSVVIRLYEDIALPHSLRRYPATSNRRGDQLSQPLFDHRPSKPRMQIQPQNSLQLSNTLLFSLKAAPMQKRRLMIRFLKTLARYITSRHCHSTDNRSGRSNPAYRQEHPTMRNKFPTRLSNREYEQDTHTRREIIRDWRRARKALRRYDGRVKAKLQSHWRRNRQQSDNPRHLISLIHRYDNGNLQIYLD